MWQASGGPVQRERAACSEHQLAVKVCLSCCICSFDIWRGLFWDSLCHSLISLSLQGVKKKSTKNPWDGNLIWLSWMTRHNTRLAKKYVFKQTVSCLYINPWERVFHSLNNVLCNWLISHLLLRPMKEHIRESPINHLFLQLFLLSCLSDARKSSSIPLPDKSLRVETFS